MKPELKRVLLVQEYTAYLELCRGKGEVVSDFPDSTALEELGDSDLLTLTRRLKDLARTPTS